LAAGGSRLCGIFPRSICTGRPVEPRGVSSTALNAGSATGVCGWIGPSRISTERARADKDSTSDLETSTGLPSNAVEIWCWVSRLASRMAAGGAASCARAKWPLAHSVSAANPTPMLRSCLLID
jgi:hypothetical protein